MSEQYPRGKISGDDLGEAQMAVTVRNSTVVIVFPKPMTWIGLGYDEARQLGEALLRRAEEIKQ